MAMMNKPGKSQGPDPAVMEAVQRLSQTQLDPLEEVLFQSWLKSNQVEDADNSGFDFRKHYKDTNGEIMPHGELNQLAQRQMDIQAIMKAQEAHDAASPIKMMMQMMGGGMEDSEEMPAPGMNSMMGVESAEPSY